MGNVRHFPQYFSLYEDNLCKIKGTGARSSFTTAHVLQHASLYHGAHPSVPSYLTYTLLHILMPYKALYEHVKNQKQELKCKTRPMEGGTHHCKGAWYREIIYNNY
jgi:hypothetical protein